MDDDSVTDRNVASDESVAEGVDEGPALRRGVLVADEHGSLSCVLVQVPDKCFGHLLDAIQVREVHPLGEPDLVVADGHDDDGLPWREAEQVWDDGEQLGGAAQGDWWCGHGPSFRWGPGEVRACERARHRM
ncbi:hypothetical protein GCM10023258_30370 [Terrabacter aeriphilus]|uniref:Uncharacterized protein n=1 Tax=Terrabacter aeriphilus TaxID=515662 RepID=A0ABP9JIS1_9MICO